MDECVAMLEAITILILLEKTGISLPQTITLDEAQALCKDCASITNIHPQRLCDLFNNYKGECVEMPETPGEKKDDLGKTIKENMIKKLSGQIEMQKKKKN